MKDEKVKLKKSRFKTKVLEKKRKKRNHPPPVSTNHRPIISNVKLTRIGKWDS